MKTLFIFQICDSLDIRFWVGFVTCSAAKLRMRTSSAFYFRNQAPSPSKVNGELWSDVMCPDLAGFNVHSQRVRTQST